MAHRVLALALVATLQNVAARKRKLVCESRVAADPPVAKCVPPAVGNCPCAKWPGAQTYTIVINKVTRCFTTMVALAGDGARPVMVLPQVYWSDDPTQAMDTMLLYARRGISTVFLSKFQPTKPVMPIWKIPTATVDSPQPCKTEDMDYAQAVLQWMDDNLKDKFDATRRYVYGFSTNAAFSNYLGYCLSDKFLGTYQSSDCLVEKGFPVATNLEALASNWFQKNDYFPVYPCYDPKGPLMTCLASGKDDPYTWNAKGESMHPHAYKRTIDEGHLAAIIMWPSISGHKQAPNMEDWAISCLGILPPCKPECWTAGAKDPAPTCPPCARPKDSLVAALPAEITGTFGGGDQKPRPKPSTATCTHTIRPRVVA